MEVPIPLGAGFEMTYAPWLAVVPAAEGGSGLVAPKGAGGSATKNGYELFGFDGFDSFNPTDPGGSYLTQLLAAITQAGGIGSGHGTIGIELRSLPTVAARAIEQALPQWKVIDIEPAMQQARSIKTNREIALLRRASAVADVAHNTLAELCREAGRTEFEMFAEISKRTFSAAGRDIPLTGELVTGPRTAVVNYPDGPRERTTEPGDAALMDLSGRVDGFWFDCTNTHVIGGVKPTADRIRNATPCQAASQAAMPAITPGPPPCPPPAEQIRYAKASQGACEAGMAALKPGARACDAAAAAAAAFARFGLPIAHYTGHQIGVTVNELPRLVPYDETRIQAGMVFSVEPGAYQGPGGTFGSRSEKMVLVTDSGPEILSTFSWGI